MRIYNFITTAFVWVTASACEVTIQQAVAPSALDATERSSFTSDGRLFVIGVRPDELAELRGTLAEVVRTSDGGHSTRDVVEGTLEGTVDGRIGGAPAGDPCVFSGMKAQGMRIYAACVAQTNYRAALLEVDLSAGTVRAGYFTSCNAEPSTSPCASSRIYPNGMGIDAQGRIYVSDMFSHIMLTADVPTISVEGSGTIEQIVVDSSESAPGVLKFTHHVWFKADILADGLFANGIQIDGNTLYYAAGANINRVSIEPDGTAGQFGVHYRGAALSTIDDFCMVDGRMAIARALPPALVAVDRVSESGTARELGVRDVDISMMPSSISYQADLPAGNPLFPADSLIVTSFLGGGIYTVSVAQN